MLFNDSFSRSSKRWRALPAVLLGLACWLAGCSSSPVVPVVVAPPPVAAKPVVKA
jgi:hypothetical protein